MGKGKHKGKKKRSEGEKVLQRARTAKNKIRTQLRIEKRIALAKARRERNADISN